MDVIYVSDQEGANISDYEAIQKAIDKAIQQNKPVQFDNRTYLIEKELLVPDFAVLQGVPYCGSSQTIIKVKLEEENSPIRSVMAITGNRKVVIRDIAFDPNREATYGLYIMGASQSTFERITVRNALSDGIHLPDKDDSGDSTINDTNVWHELNCSNNGTLYLTDDEEFRKEYLGDAEVALYVSKKQVQSVDALASIEEVGEGANYEVFINFSSNIDLVALNIRQGDPMRIGTGEEEHHLMIAEVISPTKVKVAPAFKIKPDDAISDLPFAIGHGDGYHEVRHGDNNLSSFYNGLFRNNAGYAFGFNGLYGPTVIGHQIDYHPFWAIRFGTRGSNPVIGARVIGVYFERIKRKPFLLISTKNIGIYHPMDAQYATDPVDYLGFEPNNVSGLYVNEYGIKPITYMVNHLDSNSIVNATVKKNLYLQGIVLQEATFNQTYDPNAVFVLIRTADAVPATFTGTPTFKVPDKAGKLMILVNKGPGSVKIQDDNTLPGSKLKLTSGTLDMGMEDSLTMIYDGDYWIELSRTTRNGSS